MKTNAITIKGIKSVIAAIACAFAIVIANAVSPAVALADTVTYYTELVYSPYYNQFVTWSPDGTVLLERGRYADVYAVRLANGTYTTNHVTRTFDLTCDEHNRYGYFSADNQNLVEWDYDYYVAHRSAQPGMVISDMQPGYTVTVDGAPIRIEGTFYMPKYTTIDKVKAAAGMAPGRVIFQTCVVGDESIVQIVYGTRI